MTKRNQNLVNSNNSGIVNYNKYWDGLNTENYEGMDIPKMKKIKKASCFKRIVSKQKRRFENDQFDLDMAYISKRVIAMGYPAKSLEGIYRNSLHDVIKFFNTYHNDNVKIYNLCLEKERIYEKKFFNKSLVGLFPSKDHNPCPIKLILEFCVDIILYLIKNPNGVAAIHCKAGKGRTGVMICSYLIFSGLCKNADHALEHYAIARTYNKKGVTIPSQIRYIRYFETFLESTFSKPYIFLIPKIAKYHINCTTTNIVQNFIMDQSYFVFKNKFKIKTIEIGPFSSAVNLNIQIFDFVYNEFNVTNFKKTMTTINGKNYFSINFDNSLTVDTDINIKVSGALQFSLWCNLWYSTLNQIKNFLENFHTENIVSPYKEESKYNLTRYRTKPSPKKWK
jgi:protein-tyrosine phosphatase